MESRRNLYYKGNTVRPPKIGDKCRNDVKNSKKKFFTEDSDGNKLKNPNKYKDKVCATTKCLWCDYEFKSYRVVCPVCHNCQFCGFYSYSFNHCQECGNHADKETEFKIKRYKL